MKIIFFLLTILCPILNIPLRFRLELVLHVVQLYCGVIPTQMNQQSHLQHNSLVRHKYSCSSHRYLKLVYKILFCILFVAPSRPARPNATNVLSRSCLIKWKLPDSPNGDIHFYLLSLYKNTDNIDPSISHKTSNIDTFRHPAKNSTLQMKLLSLSPYTFYGAAVTAVNIMNNTELKSKQSELVNFTTADESQFCSIL